MARPQRGLLAGFLFAGTILLSLPLPALAGGGGPAVGTAQSGAWQGVLLAGDSTTANPADQPPAGVSAEAWRAAKELIKLNGGEQQARAVLMAIRSQLIAVIAQASQKSAAEVAPIFDRIVMPAMEKDLPYLLDGVTRIYATSFTADELHQLARFAATPLGQKLATMAPRLAAESAQLGLDWGKRVVPEILREKQEELKANGVKI